MATRKPKSGRHELDAKVDGKFSDGSQHSLQISYSSPFPNPALVKQYNDISPGLGTDLVKQGMKQTDHRMSLEKSWLSNTTVRSWGGLISGLLIIGYLGHLGYELAMGGHDAVAGVIFGTTILSVAGIFVIGRNQQEKERGTRSKTMTKMLEGEPDDQDE